VTRSPPKEGKISDNRFEKAEKLLRSVEAARVGQHPANSSTQVSYTDVQLPTTINQLNNDHQDTTLYQEFDNDI
jgi:hypothetical protein